MTAPEWRDVRPLREALSRNPGGHSPVDAIADLIDDLSRPPRPLHQLTEQEGGPPNERYPDPTAAEVARCSTCPSPAPNLHPAVQEGGEVQLCPDVFHSTITPENTAARVAELRRDLPRYYPGRDGWWTQPPADLPATLATVDDVRKVCEAAGMASLDGVDGSGIGDGWTDDDATSVVHYLGVISVYSLRLPSTGRRGGRIAVTSIGDPAGGIVLWHLIQAARSTS